MSEPTVTSTSDTHSARISKPHPHSVAHEGIPPESHPAGNAEHGTTGPNDAPPGAPAGEQYPPQLHAGHVGLGPHYAEVHRKETGLAAKLTGLKEEIKGKITHNRELEQRGHDRKAGELKAKEQAEGDAKNPFKGASAGEDENPGANANLADAKHTHGTPIPPNAPKGSGVSPSEQRH